MYFASDNWAGAHPLVAERLVKAAGSYSVPYGEGQTDRKVQKTLSEIFERDVSVFFVGTGTAANALSLASLARPASVIFCHPRAHVMHEGGAVELMTNGGKLVPARPCGPGASKIDPEGLTKAIAPYLSTDASVGNRIAFTLSQATEAGTIYSVEEIAALSSVAHSAGLKVHMDGARFSNAIAALGVTPAEMTWKAGLKKTIASAHQQPFFVPPSERMSIPAFQVISAGVTPRAAIALEKRAPSMWTLRPAEWATDESAAISSTL
ncbi:MAG: hypothetical protein KL863_06190 [Rhizobium sp.]|nr:hypothetical protein [Rhizobium sp.]